MKSIKMMITGALLILFGPLMNIMDVGFSALMILSWVFGIPVFLIGLWMPSDGSEPPTQLEDLPQKECPNCGKKHDFDYPKCPLCGFDY